MVLLRREQWIMKVQNYLVSLACLLAVIFVPGCIVIDSNSGPLEVAEVEIDCAPPPPPVVVVTRPPPPSGLHIWIDGHYVVRSGAWIWVGGYWARPPHRGAVWTPGHIRQRQHVYLWQPGRWH